MSEIIERCIREFGTTDNLRNCWYVLPDGRCLDDPGEAHADIAECIPDEMNDRIVEEGASTITTFEIATGAVRVSWHRNLLDSACAQPITEQQRRTLRDLFGRQPVSYDVYRGDGTVFAGAEGATLRLFLRDNERCRAR
jgi:hypothetical protein